MLRFSNITEHINREQQNMKQFFNNIQNSMYKEIDNENSNLHALQYLNRIAFT